MNHVIPQSCPKHLSLSRIPKRGFAVIVALTMMSFIMVLLLTLAVYASVELQGVYQSKQLLQARANALLGANMALAQLQEMAGPDTRVTAPIKAQADTRPNQLLIGQALDAAAYEQTDDSSPLTYNQDFAQPLGYFISGSDDDDFDPLTFWPFEADGTAATGYALLVGGGSASATKDSNSDGIPDDYVAAPLVTIDGNQNGAYAWWIADEGQKAQINVVDPYLESTGTTNSREQAITAQRTGSEAMFDNFDPTNSDQRQTLQRSNTIGDLNLVDNLTTDTQVAESYFHDVTFQSSGLMTNTRRGGLMRDLTAVMKEAEDNGGEISTSGEQWEQLIEYQEERIDNWRKETVALETLGAQPGDLPNKHWNALQSITLREDQADDRLATGIFPPLTDMHTQFDQGGAPWEQLITWATLQQRRGSSSLEAQGRWQETMEVSPVIAKVAISAYATVDYPEATLHFLPSVVLWNPYNEPMQLPANTRLVVSYDQGNVDFWLRLRVSHPSWYIPNDVVFKAEADQQDNVDNPKNKRYKGLSNYDHIPQSSKTWGSLMWTPCFIFRWETLGDFHKEQFIFNLRSRSGGSNILIEPGQARIFTMHQHVDVTPSTPGVKFDPTVDLMEGLPPDPGQFGLYLTENLEEQMDDHPVNSYPQSVNHPHSGILHREPTRGYNVWHPITTGGGHFNARPQSLPYPFPLDPTNLTGDKNYLIYEDADAPSSSICVNKEYLKGWKIEELGLELGSGGNHGTRSMKGMTITLDEGPGTQPMVDVVNLNAVLPSGLQFARLSDSDNTSVDAGTGLPIDLITPVIPAEDTPSDTTGLDVLEPLWGLTYGLRLPENVYNYDIASGANQSSVDEGLAAPIRWLVDVNPVAPYPSRDPSSRNVFKEGKVRALDKVSSKKGFESPAGYSGGFFMESERLGNLVMSTPDDLNQFIGATDAANPSWSGGAPQAILYEIPESSEDIGSIAALMHAPLTPTSHALMPAPNGLPGQASISSDRSLLPYTLSLSAANYGFMQPTYTIGNSRAHLMVDRARAKQSFYESITYTQPSDHGENIPYASTTNPALFKYGIVPGGAIYGNEPPASFFPGYDASWVYNEVLWDDFFFTPESNSRLAWQDGQSSTDRDFTESAEKVSVEGAFNINSVSVSAWATLLSSMMGVELGSDTSTSDSAAFNRFIAPEEAVFDETNDDYFSDSAYGGYRRLTGDQIWDDADTPDDLSDDTGLAVRIVEQVRERGPFLSMSDFVNRALIPSVDDTDGHGLAGALQTAIDKSDINTAMGESSDTISWIDPDTEMDLDWVGHNDFDNGKIFDGLSLDNLDTWVVDSDTGTPTIERGVRRNAGAPGELTQADILARIGAVLRPRSDTFTIRAQGIAGDTFGSNATAWCEMTVQRVLDYVDSTDPASDSISELSSTNQIFGRRFEVVSFRWLSEEEI